MNIPHEKYPSIQRLSSETVIITEKIDGSNACIFVGDDGQVLVGSRNQWLTEKDHNFNLWHYVQDNMGRFAHMGPGYHYGEWYGAKIQRGYGLTEKRFVSFEWWRDDLEFMTVPVLYEGEYRPDLFDHAIEQLSTFGSKLVSGFMKPEGIVIQFKSNAFKGAKFKKFCENDRVPKSKQEQR